MWFVGTSCLPYDVYVDQGNVPVWFYLYGKLYLGVMISVSNLNFNGRMKKFRSQTLI